MFYSNTVRIMVVYVVRHVYDIQCISHTSMHIYNIYVVRLIYMGCVRLVYNIIICIYLFIETQKNKLY